MSTPTLVELAPRHLAVLRAVAAGRAELTGSCEPDLYVDGRCCTDHTVAGLLSRAGLITTPPPVPTGTRVVARLTPVGRAVLAQPSVETPRPGRNEPGAPPSPGRVSPTTHQSAEASAPQQLVVDHI